MVAVVKVIDNLSSVGQNDWNNNWKCLYTILGRWGRCFFNQNFKTILNDTVVTNAYICKSKSKTKLTSSLYSCITGEKLH